MPIPVPHPKQIPSKFSPYCGLVCQTAGRVPPVETLRGVKSESVSCFRALFLLIFAVRSQAGESGLTGAGQEGRFPG